ncbi:separin [Coccinella septempunctata]|uniref:separin n=1 Tax=Coccinella septempunctata TaxID=41139 RepID=UPI001D07D184|nr:separin [Coccinella septempunctata]
METFDSVYEEEIKCILEELQNVTHLPGPIYQKLLRFKAEILIDKSDEELLMILHLVESHIPGLRLRATVECDSNIYEEKSHRSFMKKDYLNPFSCVKSDVQILLERVVELPKEWTVIQLTPRFSSKNIFAINSDDLTLSGVHITVFNCGEKNENPYCVTLPAGNAFSIMGDMRKLKNNLKEIYSIPYKKVTEVMSTKSKKMYHKRRLEMEDVLECLLREIEDTWLGAWKCLLIGKYEDNLLEINIRELVNVFLKEQSHESSSKKVQNILVQTAKYMLSTTEDESSIDKYMATVLEYCFPGENLKSSWNTFWNHHRIDIQNKGRHPVILIIDEALDAFPWEMISTLNGQPSSRMSSLHLLYAMYKAHEDSIIGGYKIISSCNGNFILNPGLDLQLMEKRLKTFFDYWLPEWNGMAGKTPSSKEFLDALTATEIFCYSGHGSGAQYCSSEKIQKEKIDSVVFLFGCGSTQLVEQGPSIEMYGTSQMYSLAACPCLIGMLWVVTDIDTDVLTTNLLSTWIPNANKTSWQLVNEREWIDKGIVSIDAMESKEILNEPNLLKALCLAKNKMKHNCNKAAVVARGIPVKLKILL